MSGPGNRHCANCIGALSFPSLSKHIRTFGVARGRRWLIDTEVCEAAVAMWPVAAVSLATRNIISFRYRIGFFSRML